MRIATWNVNSLNARLPRVEEWLAQRSPDVLLMQETKLFDEAAPDMPFRMAGYELAHHGEGRWNGVAIASRVGIEEVVTNFGDGPVRRASGSGAGTATAEALEAEASIAPGDEARMISAVCGGVRVVSVYAPNGRALDTPFYRAKLAWFDRLARWLREDRQPSEALVIGGDFNVAPEDIDVYDMADFQGSTHRPPVRDPLGSRPRYLGRDRPRRPQGQAPLGPRARLHRRVGLMRLAPAQLRGPVRVAPSRATV
jgi:exodeoxyribonuclease-3